MGACVVVVVCPIFRPGEVCLDSDDRPTAAGRKPGPTDCENCFVRDGVGGEYDPEGIGGGLITDRVACCEKLATDADGVVGVTGASLSEIESVNRFDARPMGRNIPEPGTSGVKYRTLKCSNRKAKRSNCQHLSVHFTSSYARTNEWQKLTRSPRRCSCPRPHICHSARRRQRRRPCPRPGR